eukprot:jgi/Mesvir1/3517/Mv11993-RA.1
MTEPEVAKEEGKEESGMVEKIPVFNKKHPLEHRWTLWFDNPNGRQKTANWGQTLRAVFTFGTVEDFWCLYNNIKQPSRLLTGTDFHVFKEGIEPKWEDPRCAQGGKWTAPVTRGGTSKDLLNQYWLNLLLAMIGEQFTDGDEICGAVVSVRAKQDRLALWTKSASNETSQCNVGRQLKQFLDIPDNSRIGYLVHEDAMKMEKKARERYTV